MKSPYSLAPSFWESFVRDTWEKSHHIFQSPFEKPIASEAEIFRALLTVSEGIRRGSIPAMRIRVYTDRGRLILHEDIKAHLPVPDDRSSTEYLRRLQEQHRVEHVGLVIDSIHLFVPGLWQRAGAFLDGLFDEMGMMWRPTHLSLFMGNYPSTPFGVHTDYTPTFQFEVSGHKTMRLWDERLWFSRPRDEWNYAESLADCATVRLGIGDALYWPANTYHVGESDGMAMSLSLGLFPASMKVGGRQVLQPMAPPNFVWNKLEEQLQQNFGHLEEARFPFSAKQGHAMAGMVPSGWVRGLNAVSEICASPDFQTECIADYLKWLTGYGFDEVPGSSAEVNLDDSDVLALAGHPILWSYGASETPEIAVAACGQCHRLPAHPELIGLLSRVNTGAEFKVADLLKPFTGETIEVGGTELEVSAEGARSVLEIMVGLGAVVRGRSAP